MKKMIEGLYGEAVLLPHDAKYYEALLESSDFDSIAAQMYTLLKHQGKLQKTPKFFQNELKERYSRTLFQNMLIKNQMSEILKRYESRAIDVVPIKGVVFAERYFGHFAARATSDIDLLIKEEQLERAIEQLYLLDFSIEEAIIDGHFHCSFSKPIPGSTFPLTVELHWDLLREETAALDIDEFWLQAPCVKGYEYVHRLSAYHTFYLMVLHGWRHNLDSMKYFLDIIQLIDLLGDSLDYARLLREAEKHQTLKRVVRTLSIVYQVFPFLDALKPFPQKQFRKSWMNAAGQQGKLRQYMNFIDYQFLSYDSFRHSVIELKHWMLPTKDERFSELNNGEASLVQLYKKRSSHLIRGLRKG